MEALPVSRDLDTIKHLLLEWMERANDMSALHAAARRYYSVLNHAFMLPAIAMSSVAGTINLVVATQPADVCAPGEEGRQARDPVQIGVGVLGIATATVATIYNFLSIGDKHQAHHIYCGEFEKMARDIQVQLALEDTHQKIYVDMGAFLKECQDQFDRFTTQAPVIPRWVRYRHQSRSPVRRGRDAPIRVQIA